MLTSQTSAFQTGNLPLHHHLLPLFSVPFLLRHPGLYCHPLLYILFSLQQVPHHNQKASFSSLMVTAFIEIYNIAHSIRKKKQLKNDHEFLLYKRKASLEWKFKFYQNFRLLAADVGFRVRQAFFHEQECRGLIWSATPCLAKIPSRLQDLTSFRQEIDCQQS